MSAFDDALGQSTRSPKKTRPKSSFDDALARTSAFGPAPTARQVVDVEDDQVGLGTSWDLARAEGDDEFQRKVLAEEIFGEATPDTLSMTKMTPQGLAYLNDGNWQLARSSDFFSDDTAMASISKPGAIAGAIGGGIAGSFLGPGGTVMGAMTGAGAGDLGQSYTEQELEGRERTDKEIAQSAAMESVLAGTGEIAGRAVGAGSRAVKNKLSSSSGYPEEELTAAAEAQKHAKDTYGIHLTPAELLDDKQLINIQSWMRDLPTSASQQVEQFLDGRQPQIFKAIDDKLDRGTSSQSTHEINQLGLNAMDDVRGTMVKQRAIEAAPYFEASRMELADIKPVIDYVAERSQAASGTKIGSSLNRVLKAMHTLDGKEKIPKELIGDLHLVKQDLDDMMEAANRKGNRNSVRELQEVQTRLVDTLEEASTDYMRGRKIYERESAPINEFDQSVMGATKRFKNQASPNMGRHLFGPQSSPEQVRFAKEAIQDKNPELWKGMAYGYLRDQFEEIQTSSTGEALNLGGQFSKRIMGSPRKRKMLQEALGDDEYQGLLDLTTVLDKTGLAMRGQSMTAQRGLMNERMKDQSKHWLNESGIFKIPSKYANWVEKGRFDANSQSMANLITNAYGREELSKAVVKLKDFGSFEDIASAKDPDKVAGMMTDIIGLMSGNAGLYGEEE